MNRIRRAKAEDATQIREIALEWNFGRDLGGEEGFIEYPVPSIQGYEQRIIGNPYFYVVENDEEVVGFGSAFTDGALRRLDFAQDQIVHHLLGKSGSFVYFDQVAMTRRHKGSGFGFRMVQRAITDVVRAGENKIYAAVIQSRI